MATQSVAIAPNVTIHEIQKWRCTNCKKEKGYSDFRRDPRYRFGITRECNECRDERVKKWGEKNSWKNKLNRPRDPKTCVRCKETKSASEFSSCPSKKDGLSSYCKLCRSITRQRNKPKELRDRLWRYSLTVDQYNEMLRKQDGKCAICKTDMSKPHIDHCHNTGKVRGLLCCRCNNKLQGVEDSKFMNAALEYINGRT